MSNKDEYNKGKDMKSMNKLKWGLGMVAVVLAAMGIWFARNWPVVQFKMMTIS